MSINIFNTPFIENIDRTIVIRILLGVNLDFINN